MKRLFKVLSILCIYVFIHLISTLYLEEVYIFGWTSRVFRQYFLVWIIPIIWVAFDKYALALTLAIGHLAGLFLGQYIGDLQRANIRLQYTYEELINFHPGLVNQHNGFIIWVFTLFGFTIIGILLQIYVFKTNEPSLFDIIYESIKKFYTNVKAMISKRK